MNPNQLGRKEKLAFTLVLGVTAMTTAAPSMAALPAIIGTSFTAMTADFEDLMDLVWPFAVLATAAFLWLKVFKKGANRAV